MSIGQVEVLANSHAEAVVEAVVPVLFAYVDGHCAVVDSDTWVVDSTLEAVAGSRALARA